MAKVSVDGTDCPVQEISPFNNNLWSHKLNGAGLRYEIGVNIRTGLMVWVNGPYEPAPWPDLRIFRDNMMGQLAPGEWILADGGYHDGAEFVITKRMGPDWLQRMSCKAMARHENVNGLTKKFGALKIPFRHDHGRHERVFKAICNVVQIIMMVENPLEGRVNYIDIEYRDELVHGIINVDDL